MTQVTWKATNDFDEAAQWLSELPEGPIACDFEASCKWSAEDKAKLKKSVKYASLWNKIKIQQKIDADALSHPSLVDLTHFSCASSRDSAFVIILDTDEIRQALLDWLVTTERKQIWHNLSFDGRHIKYHTGKLPINYEDTQILAKTLLNHVEVYKANSGLKHLMGWEYGDWALSELEFDKSNMYDERMLKYACIDAAATYGLWEDIQEQLRSKDA